MIAGPKMLYFHILQSISVRVNYPEIFPIFVYSTDHRKTLTYEKDFPASCGPLNCNHCFL